MVILGTYPRREVNERMVTFFSIGIRSVNKLLIIIISGIVLHMVMQPPPHKASGLFDPPH